MPDSQRYMAWTIKKKEENHICILLISEKNYFLAQRYSKCCVDTPTAEVLNQFSASITCFQFYFS